jgi:peptidoglycan/LPS O-acetylase OafA/YrhL
MKNEVSVFLDFLRLAASFAVFFGHSYIFTGETWGRAFSGMRTDAVAVFFVISGFVIAYVTSNREKTLERYAIARLARLYSVAIPALVLTLLCDRLGRDAGGHWYLGQGWFNPNTTVADIARYVTFSNEYWNSHVIVGSNEPYWSIGFEAAYYVLYAAVAFPARNRLVNLALFVLLAAVFGPKILSYLPLWMIGVATFHLTRDKYVQTGKIMGRVWLSVFAAVPLLFLILKAMAHYHPDWQANIFEPFQMSKGYFVPVIYYTAIGALTGLAIVAAANVAPWLTGVVGLVGKPIRWLAGATFTLYLMHQPILLFLVSYFPGDPDTVGRALLIQITTLVAVLCIAEFTERRKVFWTQAIGSAIRGGRWLVRGAATQAGSS